MVMAVKPTSTNSLKKYRIQRLRRAELPSDTIALARFLIGKVVVREFAEGRVSGRIVETEAYPPGDPAGHHFRGPTPRIRSMYLAPGHAYVFFNYGAHFMLNVSGEAAGTAGGILIRALEPLEGIELMRRRRGREALTDLASGPGKLCMAMDIHRGQDGLDLCGDSALWLGQAVRPVGEIGVSVRIGITKAADRPWRFFERGSPFLSGPRRLNL